MAFTITFTSGATAADDELIVTTDASTTADKRADNKILRELYGSLKAAIALDGVTNPGPMGKAIVKSGEMEARNSTESVIPGTEMESLYNSLQTAINADAATAFPTGADPTIAREVCVFTSTVKSCVLERLEGALSNIRGITGQQKFLAVIKHVATVLARSSRVRTASLSVQYGTASGKHV